MAADGAPHAELVAALERVATLLDTVRRTGWQNEAPAALTTAYARWIVAHGFARLDAHAPARAHADRARTVLAAHADDPVHAFLNAAFDARLADAFAGRPRDVALPDAVLAKLPSAAIDGDRVARYKVDRLREVSPTLAADLPAGPDALGTFASRKTPSTAPRDPDLVAVRAVTDPAARADVIAHTLDRGAAAAPALVEACLTALLELDERHALPVLAGAVPTLARAHAAPVLAHALWVTAWFGYAELAPPLLRPIHAALARVPDRELLAIAVPTVRAVRVLGLRPQLARALQHLEHALVDDSLPQHLRLIAAGAATLTGDARAHAIFDEAHHRLPSGAGAIDHQAAELVRTIAHAASLATEAFAVAQLERLAARFVDVTDRLGTNSHYCLTAVRFVESLVLAIVDLAVATTTARDRRPGTSVPTTFALT